MKARVALFVAFGGAFGASLRWGLGELISSDSDWPWAVLAANLAGALLLGVLTSRFALSSAPMLVATTTGFCGALTTFSTFAVDIASFMRDDHPTQAIAYLATSLALGLVAFATGTALGRAEVRR